MKAEFIGKSKHYTTGKVYNIKSKLCKVYSSQQDIGNVIAVYNMDDEAAAYKFNSSTVVYLRDDNTNAFETCPYRTYTCIEDVFRDWKFISFD